MIFHAALPADWAVALDDGVYTVSTRGVSLADEGFIHCSFRDQVEAVADRYYGDVDDLVLLHVDPARLDADVVEEPPRPGAAERFPHVYGPIPIAAIVTARRWRRDPGGRWRFPST